MISLVLYIPIPALILTDKDRVPVYEMNKTSFYGYDFE